MLDDVGIAILLALGELHLQELMETSPARTSASEADGEAAAASSPASSHEAGCSGERASL